MMRRRTLAAAFAAFALLTTSGATAVAGDAQLDDASKTRHGKHCRGLEKVKVPGAEKLKVACLDDLTTAGTSLTGHTNPLDWANLHAPGTVNPTGVPGIQIDGYFPDTIPAEYAPNDNNGWNHDAQFVIRIPDNWNGGLVVSGAPGVRRQYANDFAIGDWVLSKGYAFASTDKGNSGVEFFRDGKKPGDAIAEGNRRFTELTEAAQATLKRMRKPVNKTYAFGISNGGYLVRWQLENRPDLYDGGVDWEGVLYSPEHNATRFFPPALQNYPKAAAGDQAAVKAMVAAGYPLASAYLWDLHYKFYWDGTQRIYREVFDPTFDGDTFTAPDGTPGRPFCQSGPGCDTFYDLSKRPRALKALNRPDIRLTGKIGKPLITLHGTEDVLLPIEHVSDAYAKMIDDAGRTKLHRYYRLQGANHFDSLRAVFPQVRPILPCSRTAFEALEVWTQKARDKRVAPPPSATLPAPTSGDVVNSCSLTGR